MIFRAFSFGVFATAGMALGMWAIDREPPVTTVRTQVETPEVIPGGMLKIHYYVRRYRECQVHIDRVMIDAIKVRAVLEDQDFARPPGPLGEDDYVTQIQVPETFSNGPAIYRNILRYECNLLHRWFPIVVGPVDVPFSVRGVGPMSEPPAEYRQ